MSSCKLEKGKIQIIKLIGIALNDTDNNVHVDIDPSEIDWDYLLRSDVLSIAYDGFLKRFSSEGNSVISTENLMKWYGYSNIQEINFKKQIESAIKLAELFAKNGLKTFILKGVSFAICYPKPTHRSSCDFDCYLVSEISDSGLTPLKEKGDRIVQKLNIDVDSSYYKNSSFSFKDVHVENHKFICSVKRGERTLALERYLRNQLAMGKCEKYPNSQMYLPPAMFQALFLIEHALGHFLYEKMSLKNICDWAMFRRYYINQLDWKEFDALCDRYGLKKFCYTMDHLADYILGVIPFTELSLLDKRVLSDTLKETKLPNGKMKQRIRKGIDVIKSEWKFRAFNRDSMTKELLNSIYSYFFRRDINSFNV